jgi:hypothetical protein
MNDGVRPRTTRPLFSCISILYWKIADLHGRKLAETARFELAVAITRHDGLANRWFQPLTHVSGLVASGGYSDGLCRDQLVNLRSQGNPILRPSP